MFLQLNLGWQTLANRRKYLKSIFIYKILNNETAPNLKEHFLKISDCPVTHQLRNSQTDLILPFPKSQFKKKTFSYSGALFGITYQLLQNNPIL